MVRGGFPYLYYPTSHCVMARANAAQLAPPAHCAVCKPACKSPSISRLIAIVCVAQEEKNELMRLPFPNKQIGFHLFWDKRETEEDVIFIDCQFQFTILSCTTDAPPQYFSWCVTFKGHELNAKFGCHKFTTKQKFKVSSKNKLPPVQHEGGQWLDEAGAEQSGVETLSKWQ